MTISRTRLLLLLVPLAVVGCRGDGDRVGLLPRSRDPLMGTDRIPPPGVPVPGKEGYGSSSRDPLMKGPTASRTGSGDREPFRLNENFTPAALASRGTPSDDPLLIDDRRPKASPTGAVIPAVGAVPSGNWETVADQLRKMGGRPYAPVKLPTGEYEFRCGVPIDTTGAMRSYTGVGATPLAAATDVFEQVKAERK